MSGADRLAVGRELGAALEALSSALSEKATKGCFGYACMVVALVGFLVGWTMMFGPNAVLGGGFMTLCAMGFSYCLRMLRKRLPSLSDAEKMLMAVSEKLTGDESFAVHHYDKMNLYELVKVAEPEAAVAVLKILAVVGDKRSLALADSVSSHLEDRYYPKSAYHPAVWRAAGETGRRIRARIELSKQSTSLLRPAEKQDDLELLRPAASRTAEPTELLLRANSDPWTSAEDID